VEAEQVVTVSVTVFIHLEGLRIYLNILVLNLRFQTSAEFAFSDILALLTLPLIFGIFKQEED